jgi:uncharacterized protein (TIGR03437 family)
MKRISGSWRFLAVALMAGGMAAAASNGTFGKVVPIGGAAADLALDEARGVLYIANFTASRVEVMSLADYTIQSSINVPSFPSSVALSPDRHYLVISHYGNFAAPASPSNGLTVIDLDTSARQTFALGNAPFGVSFGIDGKALVITSGEFILFDPASGAMSLVDTLSGVVAKSLPTALATGIGDLVGASLVTSGDGLTVYGMTESKGTNTCLKIRYDVVNKAVNVQSWTYSPPPGPRAVSTSKDGSYWMAGWSLNDAGLRILSQFPSAAGLLSVGTTAIDSDRNTIYAQMPDATQIVSNQPLPAPALLVVDADNLGVREKLKLPENFTGKSILNSDGSVLYGLSDSGVMVLAVGRLNQAARVVASQEDLVFRGSFCDRKVANQQLMIVNPGGGSTRFSIASDTSGVQVSPSSGVTPAVVNVQVDPSKFQNQKGTVVANLTIASTDAVNIPAGVRVLINSKEPDQRGTFIDVPGKLADIMADPARNRYYVIRQDKNQVLAFDGSNNAQIATLRTGNTPTQLAVTYDRRYLLVGHDNSQFIYVFDLETLQPAQHIRTPSDVGCYPRSVAVSAGAILAACRNAGGTHSIASVDFANRAATTLPSLGAFKNEVSVSTTMVGSPNGSTVFIFQPDGNVMLYDANVNSFTISRKDATKLSGAYAASSFNQYVIGSSVLNASLVPVGTLETSSGQPTGFAFVDDGALRTTTSSASNPGIIQRVDLANALSIRATRMTEAPLLPASTDFPFIRTLAPLYGRTAVASLTTSGVTMLPWTYDAAVAPPKIDKVVNAADLTQPVAPGGLISIFGREMSPINLATSEMPLPTALGDSCLTVNGMAVPMLFISSGQINAQLPFQVNGYTTLILRTPGGVSDNFNLLINTTAPSIFRSGTAGPETNIATVFRAVNGEIVTPSNPVHRNEALVIYATGLGNTTPEIPAGMPAPADPLSYTVVLPKILLGNVGLPVTYSGLAPGQVGVYQINVLVPGNAPAGFDVPLTIQQGSSSSASVSVRVVD